MMRWSVGGGAVALLVLGANVARADTCPIPSDGSAALASMDAKDRIALLHSTFDSQAVYAQRWKWAWFGIGMTTLAGSLGQAVGWAAFADSSNPKREPNIVDNAIVSGFSVVGPFVSLIFAPSIEKDAPAMDQLLRETAGGTAGSCLVVSRMEELMRRDVEEEAFNVSWLQHVVAIVGVGALFGILFGEAVSSSDPIVAQEHRQNAISNSLVGLVLTELQILTSPTGAITAWNRYLNGRFSTRKSASFSVAPMFGAAGLSLRVTF